MTEQPDLQTALARVAPKFAPAPAQVTALARLSGGASQETWAFEAGGAPFILRRAPGGVAAPLGTQSIGLPAEARVIEAARAVGAPAPTVAYVLEPDDGMGPGYIMARVPGETIARRILRDEGFAAARTALSAQCGAALARIHAADAAGIGLPTAGPAEQLELYEATYRSFDTPRPVFNLAFAELRRRLPAPRAPVLVHGDFRLGNLMVGADGLTAVLDWELAHLGDPAEDLGWICTPSWRFGQMDRPVGGFGAVEDLLTGYRDAGGDASVTADDVRFWTMFGALKWGVMCLTMFRTFSTGVDTSVERAAIGRRASETELDLMLMFTGRL